MEIAEEFFKEIHKNALKKAWEAWGRYLHDPSDENLITVLNWAVNVEYPGDFISMLYERVEEQTEKIFQEKKDQCDPLVYSTIHPMKFFKNIRLVLC